MKNKRIFLVISLFGLLTGCSAPKESSNSNNNNQQQATSCKDGVGIKSISLTGTEGNVDIYTITYTDNTTSIFKVTNGKDGEQGIQGEPGEDGKTPVIEIGENGNWYIDGVDTGVNVKGSQGETGNGIADIKLTDSSGNVDTYTIYFTDGTSTTFTVTNGADGEQGIQGEPGEDGKSAFEIYKEYYPDYDGTEEDRVNEILIGRSNKVQVTFDTNGGVLEGNNVIQVTKGEGIGDSLPVPKKRRKKFFGLVYRPDCK